ncbi:MAG: CaiB/BaiF CoA-transferase family protein [Gammaproteobacteria bacterium]|nr:CaiB/BaiF CoA-transferase family protein [Gammaproteobacteria bacterium]
MDEYLFSGLKVIDAASVIAGPAAAMMLADFGADVIKIEEPGGGDMLRILSNMPGTKEGAKDYMWQMDGRNKRSIVLDLKTHGGLEVLHKLVEGCDVFITNMPYPSRTAFQLTYEDLRPKNPNMIYASLTAYGEKGPERNRKGFDQLAYWARSGLMELMRETETEPAQGLAGMGDHPTAVSIYAGIVTALLKRERTGKGSFVQTSLLANGLWSCSAIAQGVMAGADMEHFRELRKISGYLMKVYRTKDDRWLQFNMVRNEELLNKLFMVLDATHLFLDERFETPMAMYHNREVLGEIVQDIVKQKTAAQWMSLFDQFDVPVNLVGIVEELPFDEQVLANRLASVPEGDETQMPLLVNHPLQISDVEHVPFQNPPKLGEHTRSILQELDYNGQQIQHLISTGAVELLS